MSFEILGHTADIKLRVTASDKKSLFEEAMLGMMKILAESPQYLAKEIIEIVEIDSKNLSSLLVDFLSQVLAYSDIDKAVFYKINFLDFNDTHLKAEIKGKQIKSFDKEIKGVTHYLHHIDQDEQGLLYTELVFDI